MASMTIYVTKVIKCWLALQVEADLNRLFQYPIIISIFSVRLLCRNSCVFIGCKLHG